MNIPSLNNPNVAAHVDSVTGLIHVVYQDAITPQITKRFYEWLYEIAGKHDLAGVKGATFDFRDVKTFDQGNIRTAQKESRSANNKLSMSHIPVGLIVRTLYQEQMVRISTTLTQQTHRMKIVKSVNEALAFIQEWNQQHRATL
jgi:hypothetical protein